MLRHCPQAVLMVAWMSAGCAAEPQSPRTLVSVASAGAGAGNVGASAGGGASNAGAGGVSPGVAGASVASMGGGAGAGGTSAGTASAGVASGGAPLGGASGAPNESDSCSDAWLFCDDFESYSTAVSSFGPWSAADNYGAWDIAVVDDRVFRGQRAAFFSVEQTGRAFMAVREPFPIAGNDFYGRYLIYFDELPGLGVGVHWDIISALGDGDDGNYRWGGMWGHMMANYHPGDCWGNATNLVPVTGKWQCVEWRFDGPSNALHVWLDGQQATIQTTGGGCVEGNGQRVWSPPAQFLELQIGWAHYQNQLQGNQVWIDDVVIDDERIGCP